MTDTTPAGLPEQRWKFGNEYLPFHPQASHVDPSYRDGWNACYEAGRAAHSELLAFAQAIMGNWPDVGGLDGFDLQLLGVKHGLLKPETRYAPCREEGCRCAEDADADEWKAGITCYRKTPLLMGEKA